MKILQVKKRTLKHREFVLLGLIAEGECHPYKLDQIINERGMRNWTNLGYNFSLSTMYRHLAVLENEGFVEFYNVEHDNRERKVYRISAKGMQILKDRTLTILSNYNGKNDEDFYVAFSMLPLLSRREQVAAISQSLNRIKNHKKKLEGMLEENFHLPLNVTGLFIHPIKILATDIEFLEEVLRTIKEEKEKVDLKS